MSTQPSVIEAETAAFERTRRHLPHGVTGDGRFAEPHPIVFRSGRGKWLTDTAGATYLDFHCGFGSVALGYAHQEVDDAVRRAMSDVGSIVGVANEVEAELADRLARILPNAEVVALSGGGGTDSLAHGVRIARAVTGRTRIAKLEGAYHGWHSDLGVSTKPVLDDPRPTGLPAGVPNSAGILSAVSAEVSIATANDKDAARELFAREGASLAVFVLEPVLYSPGCIVLDQDYVQLIRELCDEHGTILLFDEIMSGFRNGLAGAGAGLGVTPDLAAYGKAMANGYIIAALAGPRALMDELSPKGPVFYSGTFNGHPIAATAALATLDAFERDDVPAHLDRLGRRAADGVNAAIDRLGVNAVCQAHGGVWNLYFNTRGVRDYRDVARATTPPVAKLNDAYREWLRVEGIFVQKRHMNRCFVSALHDEADIDRAIASVRGFLERHAEMLAPVSP